MDFEQLLRKYLSGAITERELEHFQSLLDRVPEYKAELRETLEIRSMLHDDALTLTPPPDLSDHIRIAVSSSFAADALAEQEEQARKRRVFLNPLRLSVSALVAACVMAGVALSPTLMQRSAREGRVAQSAPAAATAPAPKASAPTPPAASPLAASSKIASAAENGANSSTSRRDAAPRVAAERDGASDNLADASEAVLANGMWMLGHEVPSRVGHSASSTSSASGIAANASGENSGSGAGIMGDQVGHASILNRDPADLLRHDLIRPSYNPAFDSSTHRKLEPVQSEPKPGESIAFGGGEGRRLTIGVTLGAGQVAETKSPTALLQNSYYLSFTLGSSDRIGVEMGASAFQQERASNDGFSKRPSTDPLLLAVNSVDHGSGSGEYGLIGGDDFYLGKKTLGVPTDEAPAASSPAPRATSVPETQKENNGGRFEQQITYGAVFYDRRIQLNKSWDVCGRVTFGGADNALMGNVRAYAAFTPTSKNITFTVGVGGATLYNLSAKGPSSSVNYGVYYGIETGF